MRFGIDVGTTHTVVALVDRGNYPIVSFEHGDVIPSVISAKDGELRFGVAEHGAQTLRSFKRLLNDARPGAGVRPGGREWELCGLLSRFLAHVRDGIGHRANAGRRRRVAIEVAGGVSADAATRVV